MAPLCMAHRATFIGVDPWFQKAARSFCVCGHVGRLAAFVRPFLSQRCNKMRAALVSIYHVSLVVAMILPLGLLLSNLEAGDVEKDSPLMQPKNAIMTQTAPATFRAKFQTSQGDFVVEAQRDWAPHGVDRFYNLVKNGFYDGTCFFRVISGFMAQFGIHGDPKVSAVWRQERIQDDPVKQSNKRGYISYAMAGPNTRTTQLFINYTDNSRLDQLGFASIGRVVEGLEVVDQLYAGYGEGAPQGKGPNQGRIQTEGNDYLSKSFPQLDCLTKVTIIE
jgi:peptidyl-prolyl cis-trans isomerase A (cyclophilin A)